MAKALLSLFGGGSILIGLLVLFFGLSSNSGAASAIGLYFGGGLLLFGAPLLGFARAIELLEEIAINTRSADFDRLAKNREIRDRCAPYITVRKPAFSSQKLYLCDVAGEKARFPTEAEAVGFVASRLSTAPGGRSVTAAAPL